MKAHSAHGEFFFALRTPLLSAPTKCYESDQNGLLSADLKLVKLDKKYRIQVQFPGTKAINLIDKCRNEEVNTDLPSKAFTSVHCFGGQNVEITELEVWKEKK